MSDSNQSAAVLLIGNELLSGKIQEANLQPLARLLYQRGIRLSRVEMCLDGVDTIAEAVGRLRASHDLLFTSGGIGPTHDDMTLEAIAKALGREVYRDEALAEKIRLRLEEKGITPTDDHYRLADHVVGGRFLSREGQRWPTLVVENIYIMPGVPQVFRLMLEAIGDELATGSAFFTEEVRTWCDEGTIADELKALEEAFPGVMIGSYPVWGNEEYRVKVTFDGSDEAAVKRARDRFVAELDPEKLA